MATRPMDLEQSFPSFDINAACRRTSNPVTDTCDEIMDQLQEVVVLGASERKRQDTRLCVHEGLKDMLYHADETEHRRASLEPRFGGVAIRLNNMKDETRTYVDKFGDNPFRNGMGETILAGIFGSDYQVDSSGDSHERVLLIRGGGGVVHFPRIRHNN